MKSRLVGSKCMSVFNFDINPARLCFKPDLLICICTQNVRKCSVFHTLFFLVFVKLFTQKWYFFVILICTFLVINEWTIFICWLSICSLLFDSVHMYKLGVCLFMCENVLYISNNNTLFSLLFVIFVFKLLWNPYSNLKFLCCQTATFPLWQLVSIFFTKVFPLLKIMSVFS